MVNIYHVLNGFSCFEKSVTSEKEAGDFFFHRNMEKCTNIDFWMYLVD